MHQCSDSDSTRSFEDDDDVEEDEDDAEGLGALYVSNLLHLRSFTDEGCV